VDGVIGEARADGRLTSRPMASRKEEKERRRQERIAAERAAHESARRRRLYSIVAGSILSIAAVAAIVVAVSAGGGTDSGSGALGFSEEASNTLPAPAQKISSLDEAAKKAGCVLKNPPIAGRTHTTKPVKYGTNPPVSGNHYPIPEKDGVYKEQPPFTHIVHTLEHGRVEIQYTPTLPERRIRQLGGLFNQDTAYYLLFPNDTMKYDVAVAAWGHLAGCKKFSAGVFDVIRAFKQRYVGKAPEPLSTQPAHFSQ
jgi:hypothetical protein